MRHRSIFFRIRNYCALYAVGFVSRMCGVSLSSLALWREGYITLSGDLRDTGEVFLLRHILPLISGHSVKEVVVFDVGAHQGEYSRYALASDARVRVHAFEPSTEPLHRLEKIAPNYGGRMTVVPFAVGEVDGMTSFFAASSRSIETFDDTEFSSRDRGALVYFGKEFQEVVVPMVSIDTYRIQSNVAYVDVLKIDVEGFEREVLRGAYDSLQQGAIGIVQFECNPYVSERGILEKDLVSLLPHHDCFRLSRWGLIPLFSERESHLKIHALHNICAIPRGFVKKVRDAGYVRGL